MNITVLNPYELSDPEVIAMILAFYSRSSKPIKERLETLGNSEEKIKESLKKYYLDYGHQSIGDLGSAAVFLEGLSFLAAKAFEASPLFNGQESSSRYLDFSNREMIDPLETPQSKEILNSWMSFYSSIQEDINDYLRNKNPKDESQDDVVYENAIKAKTFDITRSLLPGGMTTQMGLKMTFSSLSRLLSYLSQHPLREVSSLSGETFEKLMKQFPSSFRPQSPQKANYIKDVVDKEFYLQFTPPFPRNLAIIDSIDETIFDKEYTTLKNRTKGSMLPSYLNAYGTFKFEFSLDYGSWRDLQRHRNTLSNRCCSLSHLDSFNYDYINFLPEELKNTISNFIIDQYEKIFILKQSLSWSRQVYELQYYYPLGNNVNCELVLTLPELFYILELRSSKSVHFTLRNLIHDIWNRLKPKYSVIPSFIDEEPSEFFYSRGNQTIKKRWER